MSSNIFVYYMTRLARYYICNSDVKVIYKDFQIENKTIHVL